MSGHQHPPRQPAHIQMTRDGGPGMSITIGKIHGSVSVANKGYVTNHYVEETPSLASRHRDRVSSSDSDPDSSDSDSASQFFAGLGVPKPSKNVFKNMSKMSTTVTQMVTPSAEVSTMVIKGGQKPTAYDRHGRSVTLTPQVVTYERTSLPQRPANTTKQLPAPPKEPCTIYEQQTLRYRIEMTQFSSSLAGSVVDEVLIHRIAPQLGQGWRRVLRYLDMPDALIDIVHQQSGEVRESVLSLLLEWTRRCSSGTPTVHALVEALVRADYVHVLRDIKQH